MLKRSSGFLEGRPPQSGKRQDDDVVQAAWLYYVGNFSQQDISERLGISRFKVIRTLADAREQGLVRISVEHQTTPTLELADQLMETFDLREVKVAAVPAPSPDHAYERTAVGILAASYLTRIAAGDTPRVIGVGWGRTLSAMADHLTGLSNRSLTFVSLMGSVSLATRTAPGDVCVRLATQTGGRAMVLPAPFVADSAEACATILEQRLVRETLSVARSASHALMSVGECRDGAILFEGGLFSAEQIAELRGHGVVGDCSGVFFEAGGTVADIALNQCTPCIKPEEMGKMDVTIMAGGATKAAATLAVLRAGFDDRLLIDETLARVIIERA